MMKQSKFSRYALCFMFGILFLSQCTLHSPEDSTNTSTQTITKVSLRSNSITVNGKDITSLLEKENGGNLNKADISYEIFYVESSSTTPQSKEDILKGKKIVRTGDASDLTLDKLKPGTSYHIIVRAVHKNGTKVESSATVFTTEGSNATAPGAVDASSITVTPSTTSSTSMSVSWTAPDLSNAKKADGSALSAADLSYEVYYVANTATTAATAATVLAGTKIAVAAGATSADILSLTADTQYHLLVRAINTTDTSKYSDSAVRLGKTSAAASAPGAVDASSITVTPSTTSTTSMSVSWTAPDVTNAKKADGSALTVAELSYEVYYVANTATTAATVATVLAGTKIAVAAGATSADILSLTPDTQYHLLVRAINTTDTSKYSDSAVRLGKTSAAASAPGAVDASSITVTPSTTSSTSMSVSWNAPDLSNAKKADGSALSAADLSYEVYYVANTATTAATVATVLAGTKIAVAAGATSADILSLTPDTQYHLLVRAINTTDTSKYSDSAVLLGKTLQEFTHFLIESTNIRPSTTAERDKGLFHMSKAIPKLNWSKQPSNTGSFIAIMYDEDATGFQHWIQHVAGDQTSVTATNTNYMPPNPPTTHTYHIVVFAIRETTVQNPHDLYSSLLQFHLDGKHRSSATETLVGNVNVLGVGSTSGWHSPTAGTALGAVDATSIRFTPSTTSMRVSWRTPDLSNAKKPDGSALSAAELSYEVYYVANTATSAATAATVLAGTKIAVAAGTTYVDISALTADTQYHLLVRAINTTDTTKYSDSTVVLGKTIAAGTATAPGAVDVSKIKLTPSISSINISWTAPDLSNAKKADGSALSAAELSYEVYVTTMTMPTAISQETVLQGTKTSVPAGTTSVDIVNLSAHTQYFFLIRTINVTDTKKYSDTIVVMAKTISAATAPDAVNSNDVTITYPNSSTINIKWKTPNFINDKKANNDPLTASDISYEIYTTENIARSGISQETVLRGTMKSVGAGITEVDILGLKAETQYHVLIRSINATDTTKYSDSNVMAAKTIKKIITANDFAISSTAFTDGGVMPNKYTYTRFHTDSKNVNPPISWVGKDIPAGTESFILFMYDTDSDDWRHWLVYDIPKTVRSIAEGTNATTIGAKAIPGSRSAFYDGPSPPNGTHTYRILLFALGNSTVSLDEEDESFDAIDTSASYLGFALQDFYEDGEETGTFLYNEVSYNVKGLATMTATVSK